ncbi:glycoside hydrolase family 88 protein [Asticcacaulis sp. BYS171W]|uniref:Glycoside hydrolase family 88 protein n=1 Tax=Asticcacaulis aquaticus TaxID=2984212 RepID=A0ABT5HRA8_9CAUL|nr:glycoside hydrolase family 88 protein [Asticcacaulis aquaticus]MDC7682594.1 glycoside hydrolase family 88 protein [Asticcacaulis aquaticus]
MTSKRAALLTTISRNAILSLALISTLTMPLPAYAQTAAAPKVAGIETVWQTALPRPKLDFNPNTLPSREAVMAAVEYVNSAQIADMTNRPLQMATGSNVTEASSNWVAATYYVGAARLARVSENRNTLRFLTAVAEHYNYSLRGARSDRTMLNADDVAIGDLYQELYSRRGQQGTLMPLQQRLDFMVPHLNRPQETETLVWWWCDALYMAPPILARMSAITGDPKYIKAMDKEWRRTAGRLWVESDRLFLRDERFKTRMGDSGKPIYWARGNGWVIGGLARTLEYMPADFEGRDFYTDIFRKMSSRIIELQQPDGLWRADLNDPKAFPEAETSGSAFFVYGLAWGINHGLLDRKTYLPYVTRGWAALNKQVLPNGMLGAAQKTGDRPVPTRAEETGPYATGAYVLAGLEVADLNDAVQSLPEALQGRDHPDTVMATTPTPPPPVTVVGEEEKARREDEMRSTRALAYDPATLKRPAAIEKLTPPTEAEQTPRAVARFAPDRLDDLLWENDKVAHRIYGPALEARESPSGSGIDVWAKRVRYPFMDRQLKFPNYHTDRGEGLDYYDVGRGRGAGGLGIWFDNKLWTSRNFSTYKILKTGDEALFTVDYRPWPVDVARKVWETRTFSLPLGSNFTRMTSTIQSDTKEPLIVAVGISKRKTDAGSGVLLKDAKTGRLSFWEPSNPEHGSLGISILADPAMVEGFAEDADNYLILLRVTPGKPFVYYMGSAWDGGLDFKSRTDWDAFVAKQKPDFNPAKK